MREENCPTGVGAKSHNHRMIWIGRDLLRSSSHQPSCHGQGFYPLDQTAQIPIQPVLEHFQQGGIHSVSEQPVPVFHYPHCKIFLPYVQSKSTFIQFKTIASCTVSTGPGKSLLPSSL